MVLRQMATLGIALLLIAGASIFGHTTRAQTASQGLTVTPFFKEIEIDAGTAEQSFEVSIRNNSSTEQIINLSVADLGQLQESGGVLFLGTDRQVLDRKYGLASWLQLNREEVVIAPGATEHILVTVTNRESLSPGGHYAAVIGRVGLPSNITNDDSSQVQLQTAFSSAIFVKKLGGEKYNLRVAELLSDGNLLALPEQVNLRFHNDGNIHVVPRGVIEVVHPSGTVVRKGVINSRSIPVFPETFRVLGVDLDPLVQAFRPGIYTLRVQYRYDGQEEFTVMEEPIIYLGGHALAGTLLVFVVTIYVVRLLRRRKRRRKK